VADRILVLVDGRIVGAGTPAELAAGLRPRLRFRLDRPLDAIAAGSLGTAAGAVVRAIDGSDRYEFVDTPPTPSLVAALATWCASVDRLIVESRSVGGTLEDAYLELVARARAS
jgi:ABC-2 type transport system ATP-binding protein